MTAHIISNSANTWSPATHGWWLTEIGGPSSYTRYAVPVVAEQLTQDDDAACLSWNESHALVQQERVCYHTYNPAAAIEWVQGKDVE